MSAGQKLVPYIHTDGQIWKHYFVDTKSQIIQFEARINGKKIKFSTKEKFPNGVKAKRFANAELERRLGKKKVIVQNLIKEELDLYKKVKDAENLSYFTIKSYERGIRDIKLFWGDMLPHEINRDNLALWYEWWPKNKPGVEIENCIKWMRNFCKYLSQKTVNGMPILPAVPTITDPKRKQTMINRANKKQRIFTPEEIKVICDTAESWIYALVIKFMTTMATRIDETLELEFEKTIFLDEPIPVYRWFAGQNKADLVGQHALHLSLIEPLKKLREIRRAEGTRKLFPQKLNNQVGLREQQIDWNGWRKRANLGWHWTPHTCRHYCLTVIFNDPRVPQLVACKQFRISAKVAEETYVKTRVETMLLLRDIVEVIP